MKRIYLIMACLAALTFCAGAAAIRQQLSWELVLVCLVAGIRLSQLVRREFFNAYRSDFAFRTFSHEICSPISALLFSLERLRGDFDGLSGDSQLAFLKLSGELSRLRYLCETSRLVMNQKNHQQVISVNSRYIPSLNEFLQALVERYDGRVGWVGLDVDSGFYHDPYWIQVCLKNLIENALEHGATPVQLGANLGKGSLKLFVTDAGNKGIKFQQASHPFHKGSESTGMGLGLDIVKNVVRELRGSFEYSPNPTTFVIKLKEEVR